MSLILFLEKIKKIFLKTKSFTFIFLFNFSLYAHDRTKRKKGSKKNEVYIYDSVFPDPFIPPNPQYHVSKIEIPITSLLQRYSIESLSLGGVWERKDQSKRALIMTPKRHGVTVKIGDPIGNRGGVVHEIKDGVVIAREFTLDADLNRIFYNYRIKPSADKETRKKDELDKIIITPKNPTFSFKKEDKKRNDDSNNDLKEKDKNDKELYIK